MRDEQRHQRRYGALAGVAIFAGCHAHTHRPSAPTGDAETRRVGCIEVAIGPVHDAAAEPGDPVLELRFRNRCERPVTVDLRAVVVSAQLDASITVLPPFDPRGEIRAGVLGGHATGREVIEYVAPRGAAIERVCVDVAHIAAGPSDAAPACFGGEQYAVVEQRR